MQRTPRVNETKPELISNDAAKQDKFHRTSLFIEEEDDDDDNKIPSFFAAPRPAANSHTVIDAAAVNDNSSDGTDLVAFSNEMKELHDEYLFAMAQKKTTAVYTNHHHSQEEDPLSLFKLNNTEHDTSPAPPATAKTKPKILALTNWNANHNYNYNYGTRGVGGDLVDFNCNSTFS